ncbi:2-phosphosulfolactate phosphatase [Nocardia tenerifensis]|uniref:Probable 2-phosphosulfolactate phosphatase n=1 Tax=Nocardia tenerifensis TaxID=228006 RepID=A0A318JY06_9NOCA|nr:2-phosphosulfolactate phosphatase [Nocardia tenerifensis]PXX58736.1 2-phosphosulfolactate phosphatase [Nocardia tenerifensis]
MSEIGIPEWSKQLPWGVRIEWGLAGARALGPDSAALVVVDVLSFTTSVSVAVDAGTRVLPYPSRNETAATFAADHDAELAVGRTAVSAARPWSLSPAALRRAPAPARLVLPSPNGSAISAAVGGVPVLAACLRNAAAVADWIVEQGWGTAERPISVIAAGEHWPGQAVLRPALEDWFGAAAVVSALARLGAGPLSPEASAAKTMYDAIDDVPGLITQCASGRELADIGFADDVAIAVEIDGSQVVPLLSDGAFSDARGRDGGQL